MQVSITDPKNSRRKLSVAMIVRDAASEITTTLDSVRAIADEIVVLDTGSRDDTPTLVEQAGAVVRRVPWADDFAAARNQAWESVSGNWVLWVDAGETLDAQTAQAIRRFVHHDARADRAYLIYVAVQPVGRGMSAERVARARLVPNHPELRFVGRVAETLDPALARLGITKELADWEIRKSFRSQWPNQRRRRAERNLRLAETQIREGGDAIRARLVVAEACDELGRYPDAVRNYREVVAAAAKGSVEALEAYYGLVSAGGDTPEGGGQRWEACLEALEVYPFDAQLLCAMGGFLQRKGKHELAIRSFRAAYQFGQVQPEAWHLKDVHEMATMCLATCLQLAARNDEAVEILRESLTRFPRSDRMTIRLAEALVQRSDIQAALECVTGLRRDYPHREALRSAVRGACEAARANWVAGLAYLRTAYEAGCREPLCLRWLVLSLLNLGGDDQVEDVFRAWELVDPESSELAQYRNFLRAKNSPQAVSSGDRRVRMDGGEAAPRIPSPHQAGTDQPFRPVFDGEQGGH